MITACPPSDQDICELFSSHGLRPTRQRSSIYRALAATTAHPTADQLFHELTMQEQGMSLATVYNTLEALCKAGLAQKLADGNGPARYDATVEDHLHLRDQQSGAVADVPESLSKLLLEHLPAATLKQIEERMGFRIERVNIELVGSYQRS